MNFRLMEFPEGPAFLLSLWTFGAHIYYMSMYMYVGCAMPFLERACRRDGIAMAVKAKRTSLSSLVRKEPKNDATDLT